MGLYDLLPSSLSPFQVPLLALQRQILCWLAVYHMKVLHFCVLKLHIIVTVLNISDFFFIQ